MNTNEEFINFFKNKANREQFYSDLNYLKEKDTDYKFVGNDNCYLSDADLLRWVKTVLFSSDFEDVNSYSGLLEVRGGEYSNGTLYSSSRFALEMFRQSDFVKKIVKEVCNLDTSDNKVFLERKFEIKLLKTNKKSEQYFYNATNAHLDAVIEVTESGRLTHVIAAECKMKEIYTEESNNFTKSYATLLNHFFKKDIYNVKEDSSNKVYPIKLEINNNDGKCCFYYKQQICHLLGLINYANKLNPGVKVHFINLVFEPTNYFEKSSSVAKTFEDYIKLAQENNSLISDIINSLKENGSKGKYSEIYKWPDNLTYDGCFNQEAKKLKVTNENQIE